MAVANHVNRIFRNFGLNLQRWHDPLDDLRRLAGQGAISTMLDGGAYKGNKAIAMLDLFPHAEIHCFEPQPEPFHYLQQRFSTEPRCRVVQAALSDFAGSAQMFVTPEMYTSSLMKPLATDITSRDHIDVAVTTIDDYAKQQHLHGFDFIKLDLQGNELKALNGAHKTLQDCKAILVEVNFRERYEGCTQFNDLYNFLFGAGFVLYKLYEIHGYADGAWKLGDGLFLKRDLFPEP
jgi:FkbM family methyltransferase